MFVNLKKVIYVFMLDITRAFLRGIYVFMLDKTLI